MKKNMPRTAVPVHRLIRYAAVLSRDASTRGGTSACRDRASMSANAPSSTTAATRSLRLQGRPAPRPRLPDVVPARRAGKDRPGARPPPRRRGHAGRSSFPATP